MEKVVILARVSTDKQEYQRQITELTEHCRKMDWKVVRIFANKVSSAKSNEVRTEIQELIEFVKTNQIQRVVCLEISRMGRNTLEALKVIQLLNEHKVSLYVKNYNLETLDSEGKVNPVASLICTILLEIAQMERLTIKERVASGTLGGEQMRWLKDFLAANRKNYRHCTVLTHTYLFYTDNSQTSSGNMAMEETHTLVELFSRYNVTLCLQGHDHFREDLTLGGV